MSYAGLIMLIPLTALAVGDFRTRTVSLGWLLVYIAVSVTVTLNVKGLVPTAVDTAANICLLINLSIVIVIYVRIKRRRWLNPLKEYVGLGDLIFLIGTTPLFDLCGYVMFLISACLFSLVWMLVLRAVCRLPETIPFVATTGLTLSAVLIINAF